MSLTTRKTALLAAILLCAPTQAEEIQQVSCSPDHCHSDHCGATDCTSEGCNTQKKHTRCQNCRTRSSQCESCNACDGCNTCDSSAGKCSMRDRRTAFALDWSSKCGPIGRAAAKGRPLAKLAHWHCTTKAYPDSGWAPPQSMPMTRTSRSYTAYNNYGMGGYAPAAPMIYQPTDTTQQGYSYANVPQWQPNPGMIPGVPIPSNFHNRFCPGNSGGYSTGYHGHHGGYYEEVPSSCPSCNLGATQPPVQHYPVQHYSVAATVRPRPQLAPVVAVTAPQPVMAAQQTEPLKPVVSTVQNNTPPAIEILSTESPAKPKLNQVSQQRTIQPANPKPAQSVRSLHSNRRTQSQKTGGWFGLPALRDIKL